MKCWWSHVNNNSKKKMQQVSIGVIETDVNLESVALFKFTGSESNGDTKLILFEHFYCSFLT